MRVMINERRVRRNRKIAQYTFFGTMAVLVLGLIIPNAAPSNSILVFTMLIVLPIALGATFFSIRMANSWLRRPYPEEVLAPALKGISNRSVIYHYWLPARHVLIMPQGILSFTILPQEGFFSIEGETFRRSGGLFRKFLNYFRQDTVGTPFHDAVKDAQKVQAVIAKAAPDANVTVQPVIVFTSPASDIEVTDPVIPVVHADNKKRPSLKSYLRELKKKQDVPFLDAEQITALERLIGIPTEDEA